MVWRKQLDPKGQRLSKSRDGYALQGGTWCAHPDPQWILAKNQLMAHPPNMKHLQETSRNQKINSRFTSMIWFTHVGPLRGCSTQSYGDGFVNECRIEITNWNRLAKLARAEYCRAEIRLFYLFLIQAQPSPGVASKMNKSQCSVIGDTSYWCLLCVWLVFPTSECT